MYETLANNQEEFRLLTLHMSLDGSSPIVCSLKKHVLRLEGDYEALSYCWGVPQDTKRIVLDGRPFSVTLNLWHALVALRRQDTNRTLWVDALCIDQMNEEEKVGQLSVMGLVYQQAKSVVVWLGRKDDDDPGFEPFRELIKFVDNTNAVSFINLARDTCLGFKRFFSNSWWARVWVVQEIALGRLVVFQRGSDCFAYEQLLEACSKFRAAFRKYHGGWFNEAYVQDPADVMESLGDIEIVEAIRASGATEAFRQRQVSIRTRTMLWICYANRLRDRKASVASDHLYGLYGLLPPEIAQSKAMKPSYTITTAEAFTRTTLALIKSTRSLMMFNYLASNKQESSDLPSWVPDWRTVGSQSRDLCLRVKQENLFNAAGETAFSLQVLSNNTLCLKGILVNVISDAFPSLFEPNASPLLEKIYAKWLEDWKAECGGIGRLLRPMFGDELAMSAFMRVMCRDCKPCSDTDQLQPATGSDVWELFCAHDRAYNLALNDGTTIFNHLLVSVDDVEGMKGMIAEARNCEGNKSQTMDLDRDAKATSYLMNCVMNQAFFVTIASPIGLAQNNIKSGDHIFVVAGNSHPVVLRPSKTYADTWTAVSECHMSKWMHGDAITHIDACNNFANIVGNMQEVTAIKGTRRNPRWDEVDLSSLEKGWSYLLVE